MTTKEQLIKEFDEKAPLSVARNGIGLDYEQWQSVRAFLLSTFDAGRASGIEEVKEEINHENRKLLDGFSHPKDCRMCKAHPLLQ